MALDSFGESAFHNGTASTMRAQYLGSLVFNVGFFYYGYLALTSLRELFRLPPSNPTRRLLVPYTITLLLVNLSFAVFQDVFLEQTIVESSWSALVRTSKPACKPGEVLHAFFLMIPIFLNDLLFLYRAAVLVSWQWRVLAVPCLLYLGTLTFGVFGLVTFVVWDQCKSQDGIPYRLTVTVALTACLNIVLGGIIIWRLNQAQRASQSLTTRSGDPTLSLESRYTRMAKFITESSLLWIVTALLFVVTSLSGSTSGQTAAPFFELLFEVAMMLSPALLTYHVATQYNGTAQSSMSSATATQGDQSNSSVDKSNYV